MGGAVCPDVVSRVVRLEYLLSEVRASDSKGESLVEEYTYICIDIYTHIYIYR